MPVRRRRVRSVHGYAEYGVRESTPHMPPMAPDIVALQRAGMNRATVLRTSCYPHLLVLPREFGTQEYELEGLPSLPGAKPAEFAVGFATHVAAQQADAAPEFLDR